MYCHRIKNTCNNLGCFLDLVFVLDSIYTEGVTNWNYIKTFVKNTVAPMTINSNNVQVGIVTFGDPAKNVIYFNQSTSLAVLNSLIDALPYEPAWNNLASALNLVYTAQYRTGAGARVPNGNFRRVVIVVSYAQSTTFMSALENATIDYLHYNAGVNEVFAVGASSAASPAQLSLIATNPISQHVFSVPSADQLNNVVTSMRTMLCPNGYTRTCKLRNYLVRFLNYISREQ